MNPFSAMIDACFRTLGIDVLYEPVSGQPARTIRVVARRPDTVTALGTSRIAASTAVFDVRVSEVPAPQAGDRITCDGVVHTVHGEPLRDRERLVWTLETAPPALWDPAAGLPPGPVEGGGF